MSINQVKFHKERKVISILEFHFKKTEGAPEPQSFGQLKLTLKALNFGIPSNKPSVKTSGTLIVNLVEAKDLLPADPNGMLKD